jgi:hypothetical protein
MILMRNDGSCVNKYCTSISAYFLGTLNAVRKAATHGKCTDYIMLSIDTSRASHVRATERADKRDNVAHLLRPH